MIDAAGPERLQQEHFDRLAVRYAAHYGDVWSERYRRRFLNRPLLAGIDLAGRAVLEAMCGSGQTTGYLLERGAQVTGLDISPASIAAFGRRWPHCTAVCASILKSGLATGSFDCVVVVGGLHHLHPRVEAAVNEIWRLLRPGGYFCFAEPHAGSWPDLVRRIWYRRDSHFAAGEAAIDVTALERANAGRFRCLHRSYGGNVAYLLVLNSLILRLPLRLKGLIAPLLLPLEAMISPWQGRRTACFICCQWQKI